jgi:hypothetical protein
VSPTGPGRARLAARQRQSAGRLCVEVSSGPARPGRPSRRPWPGSGAAVDSRCRCHFAAATQTVSVGPAKVAAPPDRPHRRIKSILSRRRLTVVVAPAGRVCRRRRCAQLGNRDKKLNASESDKSPAPKCHSAITQNDLPPGPRPASARPPLIKWARRRRPVGQRAPAGAACVCARPAA